MATVKWVFFFFFFNQPSRGILRPPKLYLKNYIVSDRIFCLGIEKSRRKKKKQKANRVRQKNSARTRSPVPTPRSDCFTSLCFLIFFFNFFSFFCSREPVRRLLLNKFFVSQQSNKQVYFSYYGMFLSYLNMSGRMVIFRPEIKRPTLLIDCLVSRMKQTGILVVSLRHVDFVCLVSVRVLKAKHQMNILLSRRGLL